jgi:uncharacterized C2H2 Zn-finger protein
VSLVSKATGEVEGNHAPLTELECPCCDQLFNQRRTNQRYCTPSCQKAATHNTSRGPRTTAESPAKKLEKRRQWATLIYLNETFYGTPPGYRLGLLKDWLDRARMGDTTLRAALVRPSFTKLKDNTRVCFRRCLAYPSVPHMAQRYCQRLLACNVSDWVYGRADEPDTGEICPGLMLAA